VRTLRAAVANLPRGIVGPCRFRSEAGRAVRAAVPVLRCRGFSPRQLPPWCRTEHASGVRGLATPSRSRRLVTLCVLRLREPNPTARRLTSSVARRALPRGLLRAFAPRRPSFVRLRSGPVEPGPFETATRLEATARRTQDAFGEEDARSCDRPELCAFAVRLARFAPHPFARSGGDIPVTGMRPARATPRPLDSASRPRHRGREEDASSSTSAIDLRHEHP
jgi:hypothetical protein